jgi:photosystem II stability/assembly factor-like uncharacterized protein
MWDSGMAKVRIESESSVKTLMACLLLAILTYLTPVRAQIPDWEWISPAPFGTALNAMVFLDAGTVVGAGDNGIIARSTDRGANWDIVFTLIDLRFIAILNHGDTLLALSDSGAMLRSHDKGHSWQRLADVPITSPNAMTMAADVAAFVTGADGAMLRSIDDGESWQPVNVDSVHDIFGAAFRDATHGICVGSDGFAAITNDGGSIWRHIPLPTGEDMHSASWTADGVLFLGGERGTFLRSTDGATSWESLGDWQAGCITNIAISDSGWGLVLGDSCILRYDVANQTPLSRIFLQLDVRSAAFHDSLWLVSGSKGLLLECRHDKSSHLVPWTRIKIYPLSSGDFLEASRPGLTRLRLFAASSSPAFSLASPDNGRSWESYMYWYTNPLAMISAPDDSSFDYCSITALSRTSDIGGMKSLFAVDLNFRDDTYAVVSSDGVVHQGTWRRWNLRSDDGGENWEICSLNSDNPLYYATFVNDTLGFAGSGIGRRLRRTKDAGRHWEAFGPELHCEVINFHFIDENNGWLGATNVLLRTTNGGMSWDTVQSPLRSGGQGVWLGGRDTLFLLPTLYSHDGGSTWDSIRGASITSIVAADSTVLYGIDGDHSHLQRSTDGGRTWFEHRTPDLVNRYAYSIASAPSGFMCMIDGSYLHELIISEDNGHSWKTVLKLKDIEKGKLAVGGDSTIFVTNDVARCVSTDRGRSWRIDTARTYYTIMGLASRDQRFGLAAFNRYFTLVSDDKWSTARVIDYPASPDIRRASLLRDGSMAVPGADGSMLRVHTRDEWEILTTSSTRNLVLITQRPDGRIVALDAGGDLHISRDTIGVGWDFLATISADSVRDVSIPTNEDGLAVTREGRVLYSSDGGSTWMECRQPVRTPLHIARLFDSKNAIIAGEGGVLLRSADIGTLDIDIPFAESAPKPTTTSMQLDLSPQPARENVRIILSLAQEADVTIQLVDLLGRERRRISARRYSPGRNEIALNLHDLTAGPYTVLCHSVGQTVFRKLLVVKR